MLYIAISDDEQNMIDALRQMISACLKSLQIEAEIHTFQNAADLLAYEPQLDLIFLDIEMPDMNGIEAAKRIREKDVHVPLVYVTSYTDYWKNAYSVHAFDFIVKPVSGTDIEKVLNDFLRTREKPQGPVITLTTENGKVFQKTDEILYIYVEEKKRLTVCTADTKYIVKMSLSEVLGMLDNSLFFSPHRCCIVNLRQVATIHNRFDLIMTNGEFLPLAQRKEKEFLLRLHKALRGDALCSQ